MRIALVQEDSRGQKALLFARALRGRGHYPVLVVPQCEPRVCTPAGVAQWQAEGFPWIPVSSARLVPAAEHFPRDLWLATARALAPVVEAFDAVWFFDRRWAMPAVRERRFRERALPVIVLDDETVPKPIPTSLEEINSAGAELYAVRWCDALLKAAGDSDASIAALEAMWRERAEGPARPMPSPETSPAVTVCVPYFEAPETLPATLDSLACQTSNDFTVTVVDDGSFSARAREVFDTCAVRFAGYGWKFVRQPNGYPGAARNRAARGATSEFLLFLDADDIAMPQMVERFLRAALLTGDDCLVAPNYGFRDDPEGSCALLYDPPGGLIGSMTDDMHGGSCIFARRRAFEKVGGFSEIRGTGFEDYEFHVRCELSGLRWDVLPEFIYRYRMPAPGNVSRSTNGYANQARVLRLYEEHLSGSGLITLPQAVTAEFRRLESARKQIEELQAARSSRTARPTRDPRELRLLMLTCYFPFGMMSGMHRRVQEMIRYLGSRHRVTLVTTMSAAQLAPVRSDAFRHLEAIRGVEGDTPWTGEDPLLPSRVRRHATENLRAAIRAVPTEEYHAALIDTVFLADMRDYIDAPCLLTEHNIESRLLRQAAGHAWNGDLPEDWRDAEAEAIRLERYEDRVWPRFPVRAVVSKADRAYMDARVDQGKTVVAPNGADSSAWLPRVRRETATALFSAHLGYPPNVDAVELLVTRIWPAVRRRNAGARLILAGRDPSDAVRAMAAGVAGVEIEANPKSMDRVARGASMAIAPLRLGSGTRLKILEAMAWGLPVVSTTLGAEGIDAADGEHLLIRNDPEAFAEAIVRLMGDEELWQKLRNAGCALVRERYSWDRVFDPLETALLELVH